MNWFLRKLTSLFGKNQNKEEININLTIDGRTNSVRINRNEYMLVVFDLDFTLWDAGGTWCDQTIPPFRRTDGIIRDSTGSTIYLYPDVPDILEVLSKKAITLAVASRTFSPDIAKELMELFGIRSYFQYEEIYPGGKEEHFKSLYKRTRIPYQQTYFFDDEPRNIDEVGSLGVNAFLVKNGLNWVELKAIPGL